MQASHVWQQNSDRSISGLISVNSRHVEPGAHRGPVLYAGQYRSVTPQALLLLSASLH